MPLKQISRKAKLRETYTATKRKDNQEVKETYDCGAVQVRLTEEGKRLWLVVLKERGKGYCWLLCHLNCATKEEAIKLAFVGYGHRWKIEEVHRRIKSDYELEGICLQRYEALKSMNALLWAAVSFLYTRLENLNREIIFHAELALVNPVEYGLLFHRINRRRFSDLFRFIYYKLASAVKRSLALSKLYGRTVFPSSNPYQLCLALK